MSNNLTRRGNTYAFSATIGGRRIRCSLGTDDPKAASRLANRVAFALADGPRSPVWSELESALPPASYRVVTSGLGLTAQPGLAEFEQKFYDHLTRRLKLGEIAPNTKRMYDKSARTFFDRMLELGIQKMDEITSDMVDDYCLWRKDSLVAKGGSGRGLITETTVLSLVFAFALEEGVIQKSPLRHRIKPDSKSEGAEPFTPEEMAALDLVKKTPQEELVYALFKWTGLRCSDVSDLLWSAVNWTTKTLHWRTRKRGTVVDIPLSRELYRVLKGAYLPGDERVLPDAKTSKIYKIVQRLGEKAGIKNAFPHRFRDTMAVTMLSRGLSIYDVAKILGITVHTAETHYAPFTEQLQNRVRGLLEV